MDFGPGRPPRADGNSSDADAGSTQTKRDPFDWAGAARYDLEYKKISRRYKYAHALQNRLVDCALRGGNSGAAIVVDLGCGTANDGLEILRSRRNAIYLGIDKSEAMLARARRKLRAADFGPRSILVKADVREITATELSSIAIAHGLVPYFRCLICTLFLHHYSDKERRAVYRMARKLLTDQGVLIVTDLYANSLPFCANQALLQEVRDVRLAIRRLGSSASGSDTPTTLSEQHYLAENKPAELGAELCLLRSEGFSQIDIPYRCGQLAILAAHPREQT